jgi:hypothetical protein
MVCMQYLESDAQLFEIIVTSKVPKRAAEKVQKITAIYRQSSSSTSCFSHNQKRCKESNDSKN